ncbi:fungal-specific transcription factor domain-containing protein [Triangularia verruculosa]|uniref:Fungal-specific transcription factor domain-containing protein n=1 Tax=Triangularia verruculosa TaxID=2587418 RepID=A0AAN7ATK0_9PEZI|nr:fungal-specific transcription factor domain-containing protein [Triangularia verruculosa]
MALTFSHMSADSFVEQQLKGRKRPRVREAVSCWQCRTRKTRCDRESPCGQCKHRGIPSECVYSTPKDRQHIPRSRSRLRVTSSSSATSPSPQPSPEVHTQTHTPPDSCSSRGETPESTPATPSPREKHHGANPPRGSAYKGTAFKTRMMGLSHWLAPCNEMTVLKAMLDHSPEFHTNRKAFAELKARLRAYNNTSYSPVGTDSIGLRMLLPERQECESWVAKYFQGYGRIYGILDQPAFARDLDRIYAVTFDHPVHICKILLAVSIAMQSSGQERHRGRRLARAVEDCIHTPMFQKPCCDVVQVLLLLAVTKNILASETDKMYDLLALHGLIRDITHSMGLHRDPALFVEVTPYFAELRKRLWWCFVRLNLDYSVRSGTQFGLRLDENDCPLPLPISLRTLDPEFEGTGGQQLEKQVENDIQFAIAAAKLAQVIGPLHQALYSPNAPSTTEIQARLRDGFARFLSELPPALRSGTRHTDPTEELQQSTISISMTSFLSIIGLGGTLGTPAEVSQRGQLLELWDNAASLLHQFQSLCSLSPNMSNMACQLFWTDAARAAMASCWILGRLRHLDNSWILCHLQRTGCMFRDLLTKSLIFLQGLWQTRYHLGVVAAKLNLLLAVSINVTSNLYKDSVDPAIFRQTLFDEAAKAAEKLMADMMYGIQQRRQQEYPVPTIIMDPSLLMPNPAEYPTWEVPDTTLGLLAVPDPLSRASTPLLGPDFLPLDYPPGLDFSGSLYANNDFSFTIETGGIYQDNTILGLPPFVEGHGLVPMW